MTTREMLEKVRSMTNQERRDLNYDDIIEILNIMTPDEIIEME